MNVFLRCYRVREVFLGIRGLLDRKEDRVLLASVEIEVQVAMQDKW